MQRTSLGVVGIIITFFTIIGGVNQVKAQISVRKKIVGPCVGMVSDTLTKVWLLAKSKGGTSNATIKLKAEKSKRLLAPEKLSVSYCQDDTCSYVLDFRGLSPEKNYAAILFVNDVPVDTSGTFRVYEKEDRDLSFLIGSGNVIQDLGDDFGNPDHSILKHMKEDSADLMMWLGDHLYIRDTKGAQFSQLDAEDSTRIFSRWVKNRMDFHKRNFLKSTPQLGIIGDHDIVGNAEMKELSIHMWKGFFPQGAYPSKGAYMNYKLGDLDFFLTDNQSFRSQKSLLGAVQMEWLKQSLLKSKASFKFVCLASVLHKKSKNSESFDHSKERQELVDFIYLHNITGVIFLSGGAQESYIARYEPGCNGTYPHYEFCSSPMTSQKVSGSPTTYADYLYTYSNYGYGKISVSGEKGNRICTMEIKGRRGKTKYSVSINEQDMQAQYSGPEPVNAHLVAKYSLNSSTRDVSGKGHHATSVGLSGTSDRNEKAGSAYSFGHYEDRLKIPHGVLNNLNDFSAAFWVKSTDSGTGFLSAASSTSGNELLVYHTSDTGLNLWIKDTYFKSAYSLRLNEWHFVVVTRDGSSGEAKIWIDGEMAGRGMLPTGKMEVSPGGFIFGNDQDNPNGGGFSEFQQFRGKLDELSFYNTVLCEYQIRKMFQREFSRTHQARSNNLSSRR